MYHVLSDGTLMGLTKRQLIEQVRIAEHNWFSCEETLNQQYENVKDWEPVVHGRWNELEPEIGLFECNLCGHKILRATCNYCPNCGARMDGEE